MEGFEIIAKASGSLKMSLEVFGNFKALLQGFKTLVRASGMSKFILQSSDSFKQKVYDTFKGFR